MQDYLLTDRQKKIQKRNKQMKEMKAKGYTLAQIARKYGVSRQRVHQIV